MQQETVCLKNMKINQVGYVRSTAMYEYKDGALWLSPECTVHLGQTKKAQYKIRRLSRLDFKLEIEKDKIEDLKHFVRKIKIEPPSAFPISVILLLTTKKDQ